MAATQEFWARLLGYLIGFGSILLYTPIAIRLLRQRHANGLVLSTWWLKLTSYLLTDIYFVRNSYEISTYAENAVITIEALVVLLLVAYFQKRYREVTVWILFGTLIGGTLYGLTLAPEALVASGQLISAAVNTGALVPQFWHNYLTKSKGDYSPLTAGLAVLGCAIRLFTITTLNGSDPVLLANSGLALLVNAALLCQIIYYGVAVEGLAIWQVLAADVVTAPRSLSSNQYDGILREPNAAITNLHAEASNENAGHLEIGERNLLAMDRHHQHAP